MEIVGHFLEVDCIVVFEAVNSVVVEDRLEGQKLGNEHNGDKMIHF